MKHEERKLENFYDILGGRELVNFHDVFSQHFVSLFIINIASLFALQVIRGPN